MDSDVPMATSHADAGLADDAHVRQTYEAARLDALKSLHIWEATATPELDRVTALVAEAFAMPTVLVSFVGRDTQRFVSRIGIDETGTERESSICAVAIQQTGVFVVEDLAVDPRFADNRLVRDSPGFRFYAGVPLVTASGHAVGTLCVLDTVPRTFDTAARKRLSAFAALALDQISLRQMVGRRDPVTGLLNRQQYYVDMAALAAHGFEGRRQLAQIDVIDLPLAHQLAQALGMAPVESVIRQVALRLDDVVRPHTELYHVTGTRFAFVVPLLEPDALNTFLGAVVSAVTRPLEAEGIPLQPVCHAGLATFDPSDADDALRRAVAATQDAIDDRVVWRVYDAERDERMRRQYRLAADVSAAMQQGEFHLVYQPCLDMASGRLTGAEALLRWNHPELGALSPGEFIPIVARTSNMRALTDWVLNEACRQLAIWRSSGLDLSVSVNMTAADFEADGVLDRVLSACATHDIAPQRLTLEITEGEWLQGSPVVLAQLAELRRAGLRIAIDDFGVGYSNFSYLYTIPFDTLKLDQALVRGFLHNTRQQAMLAGIVRLCAQLGIDAVAEGVETAEEHAGLLDLGCRVAQGYYYARPMVPSAIGSVGLTSAS